MIIDDSVPMTSAEFRILRERLGVEIAWLANEFAVQPRAVHRWETGARPVPAARAQQLRDIVAATDRFIAQIVAELSLDDEDPQVALTYRTDAEYHAHHPDLDWPAAWHRAAMGRAAEQIPGLRLRFFTDTDTDTDDDSEGDAELENLIEKAGDDE